MSIFGLITTTFNIVSEMRISEREIKDFRNRSMEEAKLKLKVLVDTISSSMEGKTLEEMGVVLKTTRYDDEKGYFWINDLTEPYTIMKYHPISEALIGKEFKNEKYNVVGEDKKNFLSVLVGEVKKNGDGYVEYLWPKPNEEQNQPKLSYGKKIGTDLMIGTGFYIDDIEKKLRRKKKLQKKQY